MFIVVIEVYQSTKGVGEEAQIKILARSNHPCIFVSVGKE